MIANQSLHYHACVYETTEVINTVCRLTDPMNLTLKFSSSGSGIRWGCFRPSNLQTVSTESKSWSMTSRKRHTLHFWYETSSVVTVDRGRGRWSPRPSGVVSKSLFEYTPVDIQINPHACQFLFGSISHKNCHAREQCIIKSSWGTRTPNWLGAVNFPGPNVGTV